MAKKRFTFADAKEKIKELEKQIVDLTDNIVTHEELEVLKYQQKKYFELMMEKELSDKKIKLLSTLLFLVSAGLIYSLFM